MARETIYQDVIDYHVQFGVVPEPVFENPFVFRVLFDCYDFSCPFKKSSGDVTGPGSNLDDCLVLSYLGCVHQLLNNCCIDELLFIEPWIDLDAVQI